MQVLGNDRLFYGDPIYSQELLSLSASILQNLVDNIIQEPSRVSSDSMTCYCCIYGVNKKCPDLLR